MKEKKIYEQSLIFKSDKPYYLLLLVCLLVTFLIYQKSLSYDFVYWDDNENIMNNPYIKTLDSETPAELYEFDKHASITLLTFAFNYSVSGLDPFSFRIINLLLHLVNIVLVFFLVKWIFRNSDAAIICALLFALHPMKVESVVWISERKDLLYTMFSLLSIFAYCKYLISRRIAYFLVAALLFYIASHCKIQAIAIPLIFFLCDFYFSRKISFMQLLEKFVLFYIVFQFFPKWTFSFYSQMILLVFMFIILHLYVVDKYVIGKKMSIERLMAFVILVTILLIAKQSSNITVYILASFITIIILSIVFSRIDAVFKKAGNLFEKNKLIVFISIAVIFMIFATYIYVTRFYNDPFEYSILHRGVFALYSLGFYLFMFLFPVNLNAIHPYPEIENGLLPVIYYVYSLILLIVAIVTIWFMRRSFSHKREMLFGLFFFVLTISLVLHIFPIKGRVLVADRYSYLAYLGLALFISFVLMHILNRNRKLKNGIILILALFLSFTAYQSWNRIDVWQNNITFFSDIISKKPDIAFAYMNLGTIYLNSGKYEEAIKYYNSGLQKDPDIQDKAMILTSRGQSYFELGKLQLAFADCNEAIKLDSTNFLALNNRAWYNYTEGEYTKAMADYNHSIRLKSNYYLSYLNRGLLYSKLGSFEKAIQDFNMVINIEPKHFPAYNKRGWANLKLNQLNEAIADFNYALKQKPNYEIALLNRAWSYFLLEQYDKSFVDYKYVTTINPNNGKAYFYAGLSKYRLNDLSLACEYWNISEDLGFPDAAEMRITHCN